MLPLGARIAGQFEGRLGDAFKTLQVASLCIDLKQLEVDGNTAWVRAQCFLEDFLGLQVATVGQVDVGLGHGVNIISRIKLAGGVNHGRTAGAVVACVYALAAARSEKRIRLKPALQVSTIDLRCILALPDAVKGETGEQRDQTAGSRRHQRVIKQLVDQVGFGGRRSRHGC